MRLTPEILGTALSISQVGVLKFGEYPTASVDKHEGWLVLTWRRPYELEIRIREDGMINWYRTASGVSSGTEGWVRYQEGRNPMSDPWLVAA